MMRLKDFITNQQHFHFDPCIVRLRKLLRSVVVAEWKLVPNEIQFPFLQSASSSAPLLEAQSGYLFDLYGLPAHRFYLLVWFFFFFLHSVNFLNFRRSFISTHLPNFSCICTNLYTSVVSAIDIT